VFFDLHASGRLDGREAWLVDDNPDLIGCYATLRDRTDEVIDELARLAKDHAAQGKSCTTVSATSASMCSAGPAHSTRRHSRQC